MLCRERDDSRSIAGEYCIVADKDSSRVLGTCVLEGGF